MCGWALCVCCGVPGVKEQAVGVQQQIHIDIWKLKSSEEVKDKFVDINTNKDLENIVDFLLSHSTNYSIADIQV